jgi:hypothetical protein
MKRKNVIVGNLQFASNNPLQNTTLKQHLKINLMENGR